MFAEAVAALGQVDILVTAHGVTARHKAEDFPLADWDNILEVNLTSVFELCQLAGRQMLARGHGKIINIASLISFSGGVTIPAYAASKGGLAQITKAFANEWAGRGVNVNAIAPGYFDTPLAAGVKNDPVRYRQVLDRLPAGRWGEPSDLKGAVIFLSSPASDYVHGIILPVDGGWLAR
jgi:2-deoxy-D-gluconate 3-dehydrogenase